MTRQDVIDHWPEFAHAFQSAHVQITLNQALAVFDVFTGGTQPGPQDVIDLRSVTFARSPNVTDWPITVALSASNEGNNIRLALSPEPSDAWKWPTGHNDDNFQYTIWFIVNGIACGVLQRWQGEDKVIESPLSNWRNYWGTPDASATAGVFGNYVPKTGDTIGLMVTAGNARAQGGVTSVAERSNTITFTL